MSASRICKQGNLLEKIFNTSFSLCSLRAGNQCSALWRASLQKGRTSILCSEKRLSLALTPACLPPSAPCPAQLSTRISHRHWGAWEGPERSPHHLEPHNNRLSQAADTEVMENQRMNNKQSWSIPLAENRLSQSSLQTQLLHLTNYYMLSFCPLPSHHILFLTTLILQIAKSSGKVKSIKNSWTFYSLLCLMLTTLLHNIKKPDFESISLKQQKTNKWLALSG